MTIKLLLLKSGEDIIADISEMTVGEDEDRRVVGYFLNKPCIVKMRYPELLKEQSEGPNKKAGYEVSLFPWMPLSAEETIPVVADWVITMVDPVIKLKEMYITDIVNHGKDGARKDNQTDSSDEQPKVNLAG
ncbi:hypothetical protein SSM2_148 [Synechococcus phage S-SM2]|jgi:hypothetical protein|uniref:Uncharacterized protein n=1 Tax=Synechococcus phage S-SM2 TaxID=444860 RepID=E3SJ42_9CAUD|nr:hypothetical protein SSM2_148 [Synechococcus phage S-SM2]ADO97490.1 hypothetical protein SSM2_148 [Synechococcus phage S-SM2]